MATLESVGALLAGVFGDGHTASDVGGRFTCSEAGMIADALVDTGHTEAAATWLAAHAEGDDDCEDVHHGFTRNGDCDEGECQDHEDWDLAKARALAYLVGDE